MSSSNGVTYYSKSMNGLVTFETGSGLVLEGDTITADTITCTTLNTDTLSATSFSVDTLTTSTVQSSTASANINLFNTTTSGNMNFYNGITSGILYIGKFIFNGQNIQPLVNSNACNIYTDCTADTKFGGTGSIFIGQSKTSGFIAMGGGCQTIMNGQLICHQTLNLDNATSVNITSSAGVPVNLFNTASAIQIGTVSCITELRGSIKTTTIDSITPTNEFNFLTNHTANINIGKVGYNTLIKGDASVNNLTMSGTGIFKTAIIQPPSLISDIQFFKDTSLPLYFAKYTIQNRSITTTDTTGDVSLFTNITGAVQIGSIFKIKGVEIYGGAINDTIGLLPTQTGGEIQLGNGLTTGTIALGNSITTGQIKTCGNLLFKASTIASTGVNNTINLFNNLTTGTMNFCNGLTTGTMNLCNSFTSGILTMGGSGTVKVNSKFQVGTSNIQGYTSFINTDSGTPANYTITTPINIQLMVYVAGNYNNVLFLPSYISGQTIFIRNAKGSAFNVLVSAQTGQNIVFGAGGIGSSFTIATNKAAILGCDGSKWVVFAQY